MSAKSCSTTRSLLQPLLRISTQQNKIPLYLIPSLAKQPQCRNLSASSSRTSRIGITPITIPPDVTLRIFDLPQTRKQNRNVDAASKAVEVNGPLGSMTLNLPDYIVANHDADAANISIGIQDSTIPHQKAMWGTMRAHVQNCVSGVSEGHICILRLVGVGYRASIEESATTREAEYPGQKFVALKLGYAHPIEMPIPQGVKATVPQPTRILLEGSDKQVVTQFAAEIRDWRKPEPYKGKGIFVNGETIRMKAKKIK